MRWMFAIALVIMGLGVVRADDRSDIARLMPGKMVGLRLAGDWALGDWTEQEAGGQTLLRRYDGRWHVLSSGGGAMDAGFLWNLGAPESVIPRLLPSGASLGDSLRQAKAAGPYWAWQTRDRTLTDDDLLGKSAWELDLMRNEIFARHGRTFKDPLLRAYFQSRPWYHPDAGYSDARLTERERRNAGFISAYQSRKHLKD